MIVIEQMGHSMGSLSHRAPVHVFGHFLWKKGRELSEGDCLPALVAPTGQNIANPTM